MYMNIQFNNKLKKAALLAVPLLSAAGAFAQGAVPQAASTSSAHSTVDLLWWLLLGVMVILLFAVGVLGNVLVNLARVTMEKSKLAAVAVLLLISSVTFAQDAAATTTAAPAAEATASNPDNWNLIMAMVVLTALLAAVIVLALRIRRMLIELGGPESERTGMALHLPKFFDNLNASVAIEKEKDILLDHNYDGIKELDNNLPPWWKYSFYISIVWAIAYLFYYHLGGGGPSSQAEYIAEVQQGQVEVENYIRSHPKKVDENTVTMADAAGIADGKATFTANCAVCHGNAGEGNVGPNLTDDYWIHGGSLGDVFKSVKYGWPAKGMKSWQADLNPDQIRNVVSYIKSLRGSNPANAKAPQGDLYNEGGTTASTDSTATPAVDTTATAASK